MNGVLEGSTNVKVARICFVVRTCCKALRGLGMYERLTKPMLGFGMYFIRFFHLICFVSCTKHAVQGFGARNIRTCNQIRTSSCRRVGWGGDLL